MASPPGYLCRRNTEHLPQETPRVFTLGIATVRTDLCIKCATPQLSIHSRVSGFKDFSQHALLAVNNFAGSEPIVSQLVFQDKF